MPWRRQIAMAWRRPGMFPRWPRVALLLLLPLLIGCGTDEDVQRKIREKVRLGEHEEAVRLAHKYLADDKRVLLVTLEYIAHEKSKMLKRDYRKNVIIEGVNWSTDQSGVTKVVGRLANKGDKTISGFGIKIRCRTDGDVAHEARTRYLMEIGPGMSGAFEYVIEGLPGFDDLWIDIIDLGLKE